MSIFTSDRIKETLVKAIVVRVDFINKDTYQALCILGNSKKPIEIETNMLHLRDGDYIEVRKKIISNDENKIIETSYSIEKNVSIIDECYKRKEELAEALDLNLK